ncbi:MAG: hypothetical protein NZ529_05125 [Cytophagaceae bacterium]|nr:hypothetical protein [Cytophagaceae bacterium]MDW8456158.1 hypothetical protein [Cytophagaceae bacterium]
MPKIALVVENLSELEKSSAINQVKTLTNLSIVEIKERVLDKIPLYQCTLYGTDHDEKCKMLRQWLQLAENKKFKIRIYKINVSDDFTLINDVAPYEIDEEDLYALFEAK